MRILYDHQMFSIQKFGGISRIFIELMRELSQNTTEYSIDWYRGWHKDGYDINDYRSKLGRYWAFPRKLYKFHDSHFYNLNKLTLWGFILTAQNQYDIYHPTYYDASLLSIVKPKKLVVTVHDMILEKYLANFDRFKKARRDKQILMEKADLIFVNSQNTQKDLEEIFEIEPEKIKLTYWASRVKEVIPTQLPKKCMERPYFLYVGTRSKYKNFEILVEAFAKDKWLKSNFKTICFGGTSDFTKVELERIEENNLRENFVYLTGDDRFLKTLYQNAQALVYTSRYEGFGLPTLEAMECRCPVICCPTSSLPEVVGDAAAFFNPDSVEELIACMKIVVEDGAKRTSMLEKGLKRANLFSWEKASQQTLEGYKSLKVQ